MMMCLVCVVYRFGRGTQCKVDRSSLQVHSRSQEVGERQHEQRLHELEEHCFVQEEANKAEISVLNGELKCETRSALQERDAVHMAHKEYVHQLEHIEAMKAAVKVVRLLQN